MMPEMQPEVFQFQPATAKLISLITTTLNYTEAFHAREIFLRELIKNSSVALDKIRHISLTDPSKLDSDKELFIKIILNKEARTLTIIDSGIGMTKSDLVHKLGASQNSVQANLSAGFSMVGVGFFSAYFVSDHVNVHTKNDNDKQYIWESSGNGGAFSVKEDTGETLGRGTKIVLHIREDQAEFLEESKIKSIVAKHLQFIDYPIKLEVEMERENEVSDDEADSSEAEEPKKKTLLDFFDILKDDEKHDVISQEELKPIEIVLESLRKRKAEHIECDVHAQPKKKKKTIKVKYTEDEELNKTKPIWARNPDEISKEEYAEFYKSLTNSLEDHMAVKHISCEGQLEFHALLFVPKHNAEHNIELYVRRVFVNENCVDLLPNYLNFMSGVVDSEDMPLKTSREALKQHKIMKVISKNLVKKCLEMFEKLAEDKEEFKKFYNQFGENLKLGVKEDSINRSRLVDLLRFETSVSGDEFCSLSEYVDRMKQGQKEILYITGESKEQVSSSMFVNCAKKHGYEVVYMTDPEIVKHLKEFHGKTLICASKKYLELPEDVPELKDDKIDLNTEKIRYLAPEFPDNLKQMESKVTVSYYEFSYNFAVVRGSRIGDLIKKFIETFETEEGRKILKPISLCTQYYELDDGHAVTNDNYEAIPSLTRKRRRSEEDDEENLENENPNKKFK